MTAYHIMLVAGLLVADVATNMALLRLTRGWTLINLAVPVAFVAAGFWLW